MKCVVCRQGGETRPGKATAVLQRGGATVAINDVPALAGARGSGDGGRLHLLQHLLAHLRRQHAAARA